MDRGVKSEFQFLEQPPSRTLGRGLTVLSAILDAESAPTLTELSDTTGLPKPTLSRLLTTLVAARFAALLPGTQRYTAGPALVSRMRTNSREALLAERATPLVARLRDLSGETAVLSTPVWPDRVVVVASQSSSPVRAQKSVGELGPLTRGCTGRAFLAFASAERVDHALALRPLMQGTPTSVTDPAEFRALLTAERAQGYTLSWEGAFPDMSGIAVPILGDAPFPIAAISVSGPSSRWTVDAMRAFAPTLRRHAAELDALFPRRAA
jgi:DNA-binding IclR family transcriptional regulator